MLNKKAQSLSLHTVIVAVLGLLVLGVIIYFVVSMIKPIDSGISCSSKMGMCRESCDGAFADYSYDNEGNELVCPGNQECCILSTS